MALCLQAREQRHYDAKAGKAHPLLCFMDDKMVSTLSGVSSGVARLDVSLAAP